MIISMTGFGQGEASGKNNKYTVEMKSVNHRFCEIYVKAPRDFGFIDEIIITDKSTPITTYLDGFEDYYTKEVLRKG